ncbi:hypothetical protein HPT27_09710 [Permianibacter sp. IMCC34836]|uniref:hypothetical protein n=1 Tax=Permianibacter fluminis TaxID=2738515 RepID=UPI001554F466|nr:hypothetical protein [Permianibacter fluminis]NQD37303.1 hypothetical protein [Permianibacter fluminis]
MRLFGRRSRRSTATALGLILTPQAFALARLSPDADAPRLLHLQHQEFGNLGEFASRLQQLRDKLEWDGQAVVVCLSPELYRLQQADAPNVPPAERNAALAWALRDVIDFPATEAALDSFSPPAVAGRSGPERLFVAVSHKARIKPYVEAILAAGLEIRAIDIPELCARNLLLRLAPPLNSAAVLAPASRGCALYLYHGNELAVSRQLSGIGDLRLLFSGLDNSQAQEQLLLEIQRTLDYYESQIARRPVARLLLPPLPEELNGLLPLLRDNLGVTVAALDLPTLVPMDNPAEQKTLVAGWLAIGAALRREVTDAAD